MLLSRDDKQQLLPSSPLKIHSFLSQTLLMPSSCNLMRYMSSYISWHQTCNTGVIYWLAGRWEFGDHHWCKTKAAVCFRRCSFTQETNNWWLLQCGLDTECATAAAPQRTNAGGQTALWSSSGPESCFSLGWRPLVIDWTGSVRYLLFWVSIVWVWSPLIGRQNSHLTATCRPPFSSQHAAFPQTEPLSLCHKQPYVNKKQKKICMSFIVSFVCCCVYFLINFIGWLYYDVTLLT